MSGSGLIVEVDTLRNGQSGRLEFSIQRVSRDLYGDLMYRMLVTGQTIVVTKQDIVFEAHVKSVALHHNPWPNTPAISGTIEPIITPDVTGLV